MSYDHRKHKNTNIKTENYESLKTTINSIEDANAAVKYVCHMLFSSFDAPWELRVHPRVDSLGLKWGLWMRPCVSVISALALLEGFQMQKSGNCKKPKHASEVKKARRPPTHHVLALQLSPSPHLKSMTHACAGYIVRVHQKIPLCISCLPWPALHWQIACVTLEQWSIR